MTTTLTSKGQVTIPKHIRDELQLLPGAPVQFAVNTAGELVLQRPQVAAGAKATKAGQAGKASARRTPRDRFEAVRGSADLPWRTDDLMKLLRSDD